MLATDGEDHLRVTRLEEREGVLHPFVADETLELGDLDRLRELLGREVGCADGANLPRPDERVERGQGLLLRRVGVELVREVEVDLVDAEPLQARLELTLDPRAREAMVCARLHRVEGLRLDRDGVAHRGSLLG